MTKDKLITIRIEESKRIAFQKWSVKNKINGATFLYKVIDKCISNELSVDFIYSRSGTDKSSLMNIQKDIQKLSKEFEQKAREQDSKMATLESEIESLKGLLNSQNTQKDISKTSLEKRKSTRRISKGIERQNKKNDLFTDSQLAEIIGVSKATVNRWRTGQRKPSGKHSDIFTLYEVVNKKWRKI